MRYLVQFSGGLDSTVVFYEQLKKDPSGVYDIIHMQTKQFHQCYWICQFQAAYNILKQLRIKFPKAEFNFNTYSITFDANGLKAQDIILYYLFTGLYLRGHEKAYEAILNGSTTDWPAKQYMAGWSEALTLLNLYARVDKLNISMPLMNHKRTEIIQRLPEEFKPLIWSCFAPIITDDKIATPCGKCGKCKSIQKAGLTTLPLDLSDVWEIREHGRMHRELLNERVKEFSV